MSHAADWTTPAETAHFRTTPDYAQTRAYLQRLAAAAPIKIEFEAKLKNDSAFAADPAARLESFYRHSPWYATQRVGVYPVARLDSAALAAARKAQ